MTRFSYPVPASESPARLDAFLSRVSGESRAFVQGQIEKGRVSVNGVAITKLSHKVRPGDTVDGFFEEDNPPLALVPVAARLEILFEDSAFLVVNKAQGVVVHPAPGHRGETLVHYLLHHLQRSSDFRDLSPSRPGIVHRLDRGTSGLILVAKTRQAQEGLARQFKSRQIKKEYEAIAWGKVPPEGRLASVLGRDRINRKKMSSRTEKGRDALTIYRREKAYRDFSHVRLFPHTGRTHQLRAQLAEARHPIVGDELYGGAVTPRRSEILPPPLRELLLGATETFLHARALQLQHPVTSEPLTFTASRPENFEKLLQALESEDS